MQITAKLIQVLPLQTGTGKNGEWKKQDIIIETDGQYPKKVCVSIWGDRINPSQLQVGNMLTLDFDVESREYNGRWYTDVKAWRIDVAGQPLPGQGPADIPPPSEEDFPGEAEDDLPF